MLIDSGSTFLQPKMPLAVYLELAAHLRQVGGVEVELIPQTATKFNYIDSQISGIKLFLNEEVSNINKQQLEDILNYYAVKYGSWKTY